MLQFVGLHEINGPLVVLDGVPSASFEEMVSLRLTSGETRFGRIVELMGEQAFYWSVERALLDPRPRQENVQTAQRG